MNQPRIIILGAGPTGLGAAWRLHELGHRNFRVYEANPFVGGLSHSFRDEKGFTWDIGGHVMFSHYAYYDRCFDAVMGQDFSYINRESWVRMSDRWIPYPFQNNIRYLPREIAFECLAGLVQAQATRDPAAASNFGEFIDAVFGEGIARHFMRPYNTKVWAYPPERLNKQWIGERVAVIDVQRALKNVMLELDDFGWGPNNRFKFPLRGGTGEFYRRLGERLGVRDDGRDEPASPIRLNRRVLAVDAESKEVHLADGTSDRYDALLTTMPLDRFVADVLKGPTPAPVKEASASLLHSGGHMVGVGIRRPCPSTKSWMYFPEPNCPFYRVTYLSNYSPFMTPDKDRYYSLLCETSASPEKPVDPTTIVDDTIHGLINAGLITREETSDIASTWHHFAEYSYPTPCTRRDEILGTVIPWLEGRDIYSRGRFGMWKYEVANTDHSLMQGVELVDRLLLGENESTIGMRYATTHDGRLAAVHDRPAHAGSGEKRLVEVKGPVERAGAPASSARAPAPARGTDSLDATPSIGEEETAVG